LATPIVLRRTTVPARVVITIPRCIQMRARPSVGRLDLNDRHSRSQVLSLIGEHQILDVRDSYGLSVFELNYCLAVMSVK
jgi:hypothetical protein